MSNNVTHCYFFNRYLRAGDVISGLDIYCIYETQIPICDAIVPSSLKLYPQSSAVRLLPSRLEGFAK